MKKKTLQIALAASLFLAGCGDYNKILKSTDYEYKYEAAKEYLSDMTIDDYPCLYILVDENGKATDIMYAQGKFDWY